MTRTSAAVGLLTPDGAAALAAAVAEPDATCLGAATRLRRLFEPDLAAAALAQVALRRRARAKFGEQSERLWLTRDGLEQATRPDVASWRARRLVEAGAVGVVDFGCGIGADALACADAGLSVVAVEADPTTAAFAQANLGERGRVVVGDAVALADELLRPGWAAICDPARRGARGRSWRVEQLTPPWEFVQRLLGGGRPACAKLAPGLSRELIPDAVEATWVSHQGELVETSLWRTGSFASRRAVLLPAGIEISADDAHTPKPEVGLGAGGYLYEPDPAVIRAPAVGRLAGLLGAARVAPGIAYLWSKQQVATPFAAAFEIQEVLDFDEAPLRAWVREHKIGTLEIKKRGIDVDPAVLRKRLRPKGTNAATLVLTPTQTGAKALVVKRTKLE